VLQRVHLESSAQDVVRAVSVRTVQSVMRRLDSVAVLLAGLVPVALTVSLLHFQYHVRRVGSRMRQVLYTNKTLLLFLQYSSDAVEVWWHI